MGNPYEIRISRWDIIALRNENGSYNSVGFFLFTSSIVALQNGKDTSLIDNIILTIERILHAVRRAFQKKCFFLIGIYAGL